MKEDRLQILAMVIVLLLSVWLGATYEVGRFEDCRKLGHSRLYCIFEDHR